MQITFILVEPAVPENVGAAARAIKTMGFSNLILVNPCDYLSEPARWLAYASDDILEKATVFKSFSEAIDGFDLVIGTSAKRRSVKHDYLPLPEIIPFLGGKGKAVQHAAVVFGREESGLSNEELKMCDIVSTVPMKTVYPSLNLSQAVMVYAWELSQLLQTEILQNQNLQNENSLRLLTSKVREVLQKTGFNEDSAIFSRFLERIQQLNEKDIHLFHSFCNKFLDKQK